MLFIACLSKPQQHTGVSQDCYDNCMYCHIGIDVADQTCLFTQSQCTDTRLTSPGTDPIEPWCLAR